MRGDPTGQCHRPCRPPKRWVHEIQTVVEAPAEAGGRQRAARQLAVDRVEEGHQPAERHSGREPSFGKQPGDCDREQVAHGGDRIGPDSAARQEANHRTGRAREDPFGDQVGDALVGRCEEQVLDLLLCRFSPCGTDERRSDLEEPRIVGPSQIEDAKPARPLRQVVTFAWEEGDHVCESLGSAGRGDWAGGPGLDLVAEDNVFGRHQTREDSLVVEEIVTQDDAPFAAAGDGFARRQTVDVRHIGA